MTVLLEVCVDDLHGLSAALSGGADRIELCAGLDLGGLTPSIGQMTHAAAIGVPVHAMIRPRANCFVWSPDEIRVMETDIREVRKAGLAGVVLGANRCDGRLDGDVLEILCRQSEGLEKTHCIAVSMWCPIPSRHWNRPLNLAFSAS